MWRSVFCLSLLVLQEWKDSPNKWLWSPPPQPGAKMTNRKRHSKINNTWKRCSAQSQIELRPLTKPAVTLSFVPVCIFKAWFVCKSWSRPRPGTASRSRSASCPPGAKTPGPCWKRWRRARSSTSSSTARTRRPPTSSSRCLTQTSHMKKFVVVKTEGKKTKQTKATANKKNPIRFFSHRRIILFLAFLMVSFPLRAGLVEFHPSRLNAAWRINRTHGSYMSEPWYIPAQITAHAYGMEWGHSDNGWNM